MILHEPFFINSQLLPSIKVGDGTLSLASVDWSPEDGYLKTKRMSFGFSLSTPEFVYFDDQLNSGLGGCGMVEAFETFLSFLEAAVESYQHETRTGREGENTDLFPLHVVEWAAAQTYLEGARSNLVDEDGNVLEHLVEE